MSICHYLNTSVIRSVRTEASPISCPPRGRNARLKSPSVEKREIPHAEQPAPSRLHVPRSACLRARARCAPVSKPAAVMMKKVNGVVKRSPVMRLSRMCVFAVRFQGLSSNETKSEGFCKTSVARIKRNVKRNIVLNARGVISTLNSFACRGLIMEEFLNELFVY